MVVQPGPGAGTPAVKLAEPTLKSVIERAYEIGMLQVGDELYRFCEFMEKRPFRNFVEIGVWKGASFTVWDFLSQPGIHIGIDPNNQCGIVLEDGELRARDEVFRSFKHTAHMLIMDSQRVSTMTAVAELLGKERVDFLFIDGAHEQPYVHRDYEWYRRLVRPGGVIALHDIVTFPGPRTMWRDLKAAGQECHEFIAPLTPSGIGTLVVK